MPSNNQGGTIENKVTIRNDAYDQNHTVTHEVGHFLMLGSPNQPISQGEHEEAGGIFKPAVRDPSGSVVSPTERVSKDNIRQILNNVPYKKQ